MKNCRSAIAALLLLASCAPGTGIKGTIEQAPDSRIIVKRLDVNVYNVLDTVKTNASGAFSYKLNVEAGQPQFIYLFYKDTKIASLLLESGEQAVVSADTLGHFEVSGSEGSAKLKEVEQSYSDFLGLMLRENDPNVLRKAYIQHYRDNVRYVMANSKSLTVIPVLYEQIDENTPVMCQWTDAIHFRAACDSLKTVYPDSRYVKALEKETERRESLLKLHTMVGTAQTASYPDLNLPGMDGQRHSLTAVDAKVKMLYFWNPADASHKLFNLDVLIPLYEQYKGKGLEIYAVAIDPDKSEWAGIVNSQKLPWINVNDGLGTASSSLTLFGIQQVPSICLISDDGIDPVAVDAKALRSELSKRF